MPLVEAKCTQCGANIEEEKKRIADEEAKKQEEAEKKRKAAEDKKRLEEIRKQEQLKKEQEIKEAEKQAAIRQAKEEGIELEIIDEQYTQEEAIQKATELATKKIEAQLSEKEEIIRVQQLKVNTNERTIVVELFFAVMEDITDTKPIEPITQE